MHIIALHKLHCILHYYISWSCTALNIALWSKLHNAHYILQCNQSTRLQLGQHQLLEREGQPSPIMAMIIDDENVLGLPHWWISFDQTFKFESLIIWILQQQDFNALECESKSRRRPAAKNYWTTNLALKLETQWMK